MALQCNAVCFSELQCVVGTEVMQVSRQCGVDAVINSPVIMTS